MGRSAEAGRLPLPEDCAVRLVDLAWNVGALISEGEDGFLNIYLNARLSQEARQRALQHELRHYYRDDLHSQADIRQIEADMPPVQGIVAMDGGILARPAPVFAPEALLPAGRGLYRPTGINLDKAIRDLLSLRPALEAACDTYDVMQRRPWVPAARLRAHCAALLARPEEAVAFVAWQPGAGEAALPERPELPERPALPVVMQFSDADGRVEGAIYYRGDGAPDNALALVDEEAEGHALRIAIDLRRRGGALILHALRRAVDGQAWERVY